MHRHIERSRARSCRSWSASACDALVGSDDYCRELWPAVFLCLLRGTMARPARRDSPVVRARRGAANGRHDCCQCCLDVVAPSAVRGRADLGVGVFDVACRGDYHALRCLLCAGHSQLRAIQSAAHQSRYYCWSPHARWRSSGPSNPSGSRRSLSDTRLVDRCRCRDLAPARQPRRRQQAIDSVRAPHDVVLWLA